MNSNIFNCNYKLLHHPEVLEQIRETQDCYPVNVEFHPTMRCNHQCLKCATTVEKVNTEQGFLEHTESAGNRKYEWSTADALNVIHGFAECGVKAITFGGGGEPLLHTGINQMMQLAVDHGMKFGVITNLDVDVPYFPAIRHASWVRVSLDAATEETHNRIHRPNRKMGAVGFKRIRLNMDYLNDMDVPTIGINYLVYPENVDEMVAAAELAVHYADYIRFTPVHDAQEGKGYNWQELVTKFDEARKVTAAIAPEFKVIGALDRFVNMVQPRKDYSFCFWQKLRPIVGADGFLYPCCVLNYYEKHRILNVRDYPCFKLAWDSKERKNGHYRIVPKQCPPCWVDAENRMACYLAKKDPPHVEFV